MERAWADHLTYRDLHRRVRNTVEEAASHAKHMDATSLLHTAAAGPAQGWRGWVLLEYSYVDT